MSPALDQPLRTRERAALDRARAVFRNLITKVDPDNEDGVREIAEQALSDISVILGERNGQ